VNLQQAIQYLANNIYVYGNKLFYEGCLIPSNSGYNSDFNIASDLLFKEFEATHFSRMWLENGKSVILSLKSCSAFGACLDGEVVAEMLVELTKGTT